MERLPLVRRRDVDELVEHMSSARAEMKSVNEAIRRNIKKINSIQGAIEDTTDNDTLETLKGEQEDIRDFQRAATESIAEIQDIYTKIERRQLLLNYERVFLEEKGNNIIKKYNDKLREKTEFKKTNAKLEDAMRKKVTAQQQQISALTQAIKKLKTEYDGYILNDNNNNGMNVDDDNDSSS